MSILHLAADRAIRRRPTMRLAATLGLVGFLFGCAPPASDDAATGVYRLFNSERNPTMEALESTVEFTLVPASRAMVHAPDALLVLERDLERAREQRIILPNVTAARGDNFVQLRAQTERSARLHEFSFNEIATRFGGIPAPFETLDTSALMSASDEMGSFVYARQALGPDTTCVLVLRRLSATDRPLPSGAHSLDLMMRNCVTGSLEQAMAPVSAQLIGVSAAPQPTLFTTSRFAAPRR